MPGSVHATARATAFSARLVLALIAGTAGFAVPARAADEIGQVKQTAGQVSVTRGGASVPVALGTPLFEADVIVTGADGAIGMTFSDNSRVALGPDSRLVLEKYAYAPGAAGNAFDARLTGGSLTAASGLIAATPDAMRVLMPTTILGVRGTEFAVRVE